MTAPFVATVTKPPAGPAGRSRLQRALVAIALLLPLLLAVTLLAWMVVPRGAETDSRATWMDRLFGGGQRRLEESVCSLPKEVGPCRSAMQRFFYNADADRCETFLYGGCDGNANNFQTIDKCNERCVGQSAGGDRREDSESVCSLPKEVGPCRGAMQRFFHNADSGNCEAFLYGGCDGNANNFQTIDKCNERCVGQSAGGDRRKDAESVCSLPKEAGPCRGAMERFFYDADAGRCETFIYGGCDGNANNFKTIDKCNERCVGQSANVDRRKDAGAAICSLPAVIGDCRAAMPRYFFDTETSTCKEFTYGGCGGNGNNFETLNDCEKMCSSSRTRVEQKSGYNAEGAAGSDCSSEPDGGRCMAYMERYAYRPQTKTCEKFIYGGCNGNGNRYSTKEECEEHCAGNTTEKESELKEGVDYDTKVCGVTECPMDCGEVRQQGDCMYCHCGQSPFIETGQLVVAAGEPCPDGHSLVRTELNANICRTDLYEPLPVA